MVESLECCECHNWVGQARGHLEYGGDVMPPSLAGQEDSAADGDGYDDASGGRRIKCHRRQSDRPLWHRVRGLLTIGR